MNKIIITLLSVIVLFSLSGCTKNDDKAIKTEVKTISSFYTNDLWNLDRLEIRSSGGTKKSTTNTAVILNWLYEVGKLEVTIDPDPEDHAGVLFSVAFYEGDHHIFSIAPAAINGTIVEINDELVNNMYTLWDSTELVDMK